MVKEEKIDSESECDENPEESEIQARARLFKCLCGAKSCKDKVWTETESSDSSRKKPKAKKKRLNL